MPADLGHGPAEPVLERRSLLRRAVDAVFGYDYFISYRWSDGSVYARQLAAQLQQSGFECFLDTDRYHAGDDWKKVGRWTLRRTSSLILVGSPDARRSEPVLLEVAFFRRFSRRVVPIDFEGTLSPDSRDSELLKYLPEEVIRLEETRDRLLEGPSQRVLTKLREDFEGLRQAQRRMRLVSGVAVFVSIIAAVAIWAFLRSEDALKEERRLRGVGLAQTMAAEAMNQAVQFEGERAALLSRQAHVFNRRHSGHIVARVDEALRATLGSPYFNTSPRGFEGHVRSIAFCPEAARLAVAGDSEVAVLALRDQEPEWRTLRHPPLRRAALALSPSCTSLAVVGADEGVLLYETWEAGSEPTILASDGASTTSLAFSPDGERLAVGTDQGSVFVWDLVSKKPQRRLVGQLPGQAVNALAFSADAVRLAVAGMDESIALLGLEDGKRHDLVRRARSRSSRSLAFSPDGRWLAVASTAPAAVMIWALDDLGAPPVTHAMPAPLSLVFTADSGNLIVGDGFGRLHFWQADELDGPPVIVGAHSDELRALSLSSNGRYFATGCRDGTVRVWEPYSDVDAAFRWSGDGGLQPLPASHAPAGAEQWLAYSAVGHAAVSREADGSLLLHRHLNGGERKPIPVGADATSAAFSPTGRFVAIARGTGLAIWDLATSRGPTELSRTDSVDHAIRGALRADVRDRSLVELRQEGEPPGQPVLLREPGRSVQSVRFDADAGYLVTVSVESARFNVPKIVRLRSASTAALADEVCRRVRRNLTREEWARFVAADVPYECTCPDLPCSE